MYKIFNSLLGFSETAHRTCIGQKSYIIRFAWYPQRRTNGKWSWLEDLYIEETWEATNRWTKTKVQNETDILQS